VLFRIIETQSSTEEARLQERLGLTAREAEVLLWVGYGKGTRDIAEILGMSPRTVQKHLDQIYGKLGVENRAVAAAISIRAAG
jgi:DNA-binding CsgD family transcriptional regulator